MLAATTSLRNPWALDMVDKSISHHSTYFRRFFIIGQSKQAFFSQREPPFEFCSWHMYETPRDMTLHPPLALVPLKRKPAARGRRAPRAPSIVDGFCRQP